MQGVGAEIAKNLILSGVNSITLMDHTEVSILDCCSQFLIPRDSQERNVSIVFINDTLYSISNNSASDYATFKRHHYWLILEDWHYFKSIESCWYSLI